MDKVVCDKCGFENEYNANLKKIVCNNCGKTIRLVKKGNKKIVICLIIFLAVIAIAAVGIYLYLNRPIPVEKITIEDEEIKLYVNNDYELSYEISPEDATNQNIKYTISDENVIKYDNEKVTALSSGESTLCIVSDENNDIKDCIKFNVTTKRKEFFSKLDKIYEKKSEGVYSILYDTFDFNNYTLTCDDTSSNPKVYYVYHMDLNYVDGYAQGDGYKVEYFYNTTTRTLSCVANTPLYNQYLCSFTSQQTTINMFDAAVSLANSTLGDYTLEEIKA